MKSAYLFATIVVLCAICATCAFPCFVEGFATTPVVAVPKNFSYGKFLWDATPYRSPLAEKTFVTIPAIGNNVATYTAPHPRLIERDTTNFYHLIKTGTGTSTIPPLYISMTANPSVISIPEQYIVANSVYTPIINRRNTVYNPVYTTDIKKAARARKFVWNGGDRYIFQANGRYYGLGYKQKSLTMVEVRNPIDMNMLANNALYQNVAAKVAPKL